MLLPNPKPKRFILRVPISLFKTLLLRDWFYSPGKKFKILPNPKSPVVRPVRPVRPVPPMKGNA